MTDLRIRKNGKYYQIGYHENQKWVNVAQLGTAENALRLVRSEKERRTRGGCVPNTC